MTTSVTSLFTLTHAGNVEVFVPAPSSTGGWGAEVLRGPAVTGLLARATQRHAQAATPPESTGGSPAQATGATPSAARNDFRPVRATFDLFRPPRAVPSTTRARTVRASRRMMLVDSELVQDDTVVARSQTLLLHAASEHGRDHSWQALREFDAPPAATRLAGQRLFKFGDGEWVTDMTVPPGECQGPQVWLPRQDVIDGEEITPFQAAASAADVTNLAAHWNADGLGYINADATLTLTRVPRGLEIGIAAVQRVTGGGIAVGEGIAFDEHGSFGITTVCGLVQSGNTTTRPSAHSASR